VAALLSNTDPLFIAILAGSPSVSTSAPAVAGDLIGLTGAGIVVWVGPLWPVSSSAMR